MFRGIICILLVLSGSATIAADLANKPIRSTCIHTPPDIKSFNDFSTDATTMTEARYKEILKLLYTSYIKEFRNQGLNLRINYAWESNRFAAFAEAHGVGYNSRYITITGGIARHPLVSEDAFILAACHEIGHHIGGLPLKEMVLSAEGQSDYFATLKCARRIFSRDDNISIMENKEVPAIVQEKCAKGFASRQQIALCQRSTLAAMALSPLIGSPPPEPLDPETPDTSVVQSTNRGYPSLQCRLDTFFAGAICSATESVATSKSDPETGTCARRIGYISGVRPLCWYKPETPKQTHQVLASQKW